jgi:hypothetical protein
MIVSRFFQRFSQKLILALKNQVLMLMIMEL